MRGLESYRSAMWLVHFVSWLFLLVLHLFCNSVFSSFLPFILLVTTLSVWLFHIQVCMSLFFLGAYGFFRIQSLNNILVTRLVFLVRIVTTPCFLPRDLIVVLLSRILFLKAFHPSTSIDIATTWWLVFNLLFLSCGLETLVDVLDNIRD